MVIVREGDLTRKEREERGETGKTSAGVVGQIRQFHRQEACREVKVNFDTFFGLLGKSLKSLALN